MISCFKYYDNENNNSNIDNSINIYNENSNNINTTTPSISIYNENSNNINTTTSSTKSSSCCNISFVFSHVYVGSTILTTVYHFLYLHSRHPSGKPFSRRFSLTHSAHTIFSLLDPWYPPQSYPISSYPISSFCHHPYTLQVHTIVASFSVISLNSVTSVVTLIMHSSSHRAF